MPGHSRTGRARHATGEVEYFTVGSGAPSTLFVHGLGGSIPTTRPFATGVTGTRTFLHLRGHGTSVSDGTWTYAALADDVAAVAAEVEATRALGVSLGSGALLSLLARRPDALERVVFVIPASIDRPREDVGLARFAAMADLVEAGDVDGLAGRLVDEQAMGGVDPDRDDVRVWAHGQAETLVASREIAVALRRLPAELPLTDRSALGQVTAECLVIGQEGDPVHPAPVARELAAALPRARLEILPPGGLLWAHRARVRMLVADAFA